MQFDGLKPDEFTIFMILPLCGVVSENLLLRGREIHNFSVKNGFDLDFHVGSCLIDMYSKCENVVMGRRVFDQMAYKNVVVWTAMITGYVQNGEFEEALLLFRRMQLNHGTVPNQVTLLTVLSAVGSLASYAQGKEIHGFATKFGLYGESSLNNALIDMYFKCGSLDWQRKSLVIILGTRMPSPRAQWSVDMQFMGWEKRLLHCFKKCAILGLN